VPKFSRDAAIDIPPDGVVRALTIPVPPDLTKTYFLRLRLTDAAGRELSRNFYWLSTIEDVLDWKNTKWYYTPTTRHADMTALAALPPTKLTITPRFEGHGSAGTARVSVTNSGNALAFQVRLKAVDPRDGRELLPVFWEDNYFELFPGETREIRVTYPPTASEPRIEVEAWNVTS
jgi:exo-1,4-beta-D-glucosaminidase